MKQKEMSGCIIICNLFQTLRAITKKAPSSVYEELEREKRKEKEAER